MPSLTVQDVLRNGFASYCLQRKLPYYVIHAAQRMMDCRTAALGGHVKKCPCGHLERVWYNSCKHRSCPQCAYLDLEKWVARQEGRILPCAHYHTVFTVPQELNPMWAYNRRLFTSLLFTAVRDTLFKLLGDEKYLGARPGLIMALHTWGSSLVTHPHIHCLVTGGGLTTDGRWQGVRKECLLPRKVLMIIFRGKFLDALRQAARDGDLEPPKGMRRSQLLGLLNKLGRQVWNVKILERYDHARGVVLYLARYVRGGPISNRRLVSCRHGRVEFRTKSYRDADGADEPRRSTTALSIEEFIQRLLQHVPPPGMMTVRSYGLYANNQSHQLARCRELLGEPPSEPSKPLVAAEALARVPNRREPVCPKCGKTADVIHPLPTTRASPLAA